MLREVGSDIVEEELILVGYDTSQMASNLSLQVSEKYLRL